MERREQRKVLRAFTMVTTIGIQFAVSVFLGYYLGDFLDRRLGSDPWLMLIGVLAGVGAGVIGVVKLVKSLG